MWRTTALVIQLFILTCLAHPPYTIRPWSPAGPSDVRGPCPALNTMANYGYIPHSGRNITMDDLIYALKNGLNVGKDIAIAAGTGALALNPNASAGWFDLDMLDKHNAIEHDASLSRGDYFFGNDHTFNQTAFGQSLSQFPDEIINVSDAANAVKIRVVDSNVTNPTFVFNQAGCFGMSASYMGIMGDAIAGTAVRKWTKYFFENEKLPYELGWHPPYRELNVTQVFDLASRMASDFWGEEYICQFGVGCYPA